MSRRGLAAAAGLAMVATVAQPAAAHQTSVAYVEATLTGATVAVTLRAAPRDLGEATGRGTIALDRLDPATADAVGSYAAGHLGVADGDRPCPLAPPRVSARGDRLAVELVATCAAPPASLVIDYQLLFEIDATHTAALRVRVPGAEPADTILSADASRFRWDLSEPPPSGALAFVRAGVHHVATGLDHIAFVLALLIGVVVAPAAGAGAGATAAWQVRRLGPGLRATAVLVSAFTVGHSLTLIAAALGWVSLPARLVESTIAASIVWMAVAAAVRPPASPGAGGGPGWRFAVTFGFGLAHGLGFARMLTPLLPPGDVVVPLLCFNVGVELAQLGVVVVALPICWLIARAVGGRRYRSLVLPGLAAVLAGLGAIWLFERVTGVVLLGL